MRFAVLPAHVVDAPDLDGTEVRALLVLSSHASPDGASWPSVRSVCERLRMSDRHVRALLHGLRDKGYVTITTRLRPDGTQTTNHYALRFDRWAPAAGHPVEPQFPPCNPGQGDPEVEIRETLKPTSGHEQDHWNKTIGTRHTPSPSLAMLAPSLPSGDECEPGPYSPLPPTGKGEKEAGPRSPFPPLPGLFPTLSAQDAPGTPSRPPTRAKVARQKNASPGGTGEAKDATVLESEIPEDVKLLRAVWNAACAQCDYLVQRWKTTSPERLARASALLDALRAQEGKDERGQRLGFAGKLCWWAAKIVTWAYEFRERDGSVRVKPRVMTGDYTTQGVGRAMDAPTIRAYLEDGLESPDIDRLWSVRAALIAHFAANGAEQPETPGPIARPALTGLGALGGLLS